MTSQESTQFDSACRRTAAPATISATPTRAGRMAGSFEQFILGQAFPCLGAKAALSQGNLQYLHAGDIGSGHHDRRLTARVQAFAASAADDSLFLSLAVFFPDSARLSERGFEEALWQRLRAIHAIDGLAHRWDPSVSDDPDSARFSMSAGGRAFYVIGLHPDASRPARRFCCPTLVFNPHSQFERLREDGRYGKLQQAITRRDVAFSGSSNPMLAAYGKSSEARQYSGRKVGPDWACPFHAKNERTHT